MPIVCLILIIINLILLGVLYWLRRTTIYETYTNVGDDEHMRNQKPTIEYIDLKENKSLIDRIQMNAYDPTVFENDKTIYNYQKNIGNQIEGDYTIDDIATDIMNKNTDEINWPRVYVNDSSTLFAVIPNPSISIENLYGKKGILNSDFKEDICAKYHGNSNNINKQCNKLSPTNCKLMDCCVLLNGKKCVAGNVNGPTYLTENGKEIDQLYFHYKDTCYGDCSTADSYETACGNYSKDSTGISKECMIKMFNNYGCPNPSPNSLINDNMVKDYSQTTMEYVDNYIKTAIDTMANNYNADSALLCEGVG